MDAFSTPAMRFGKKGNAAGIVVATALLSGVSFAGARFLLTRLEMPVLLRASVVIVPIVAFALFIGAEVRAIRQADELQRRIVLESLAIAFPATFGLFTLVELLEHAGLAPGGLEVNEAWPYMAFVWPGAYALAWMRYH